VIELSCMLYVIKLLLRMRLCNIQNGWVTK